MATLVAVYRQPEQVEGVVEALGREGFSDADIAVASPADRRGSVEAEMDAQVAEAWASPGIGVFMTSEMVRGAIVLMIVGGAIGAVVGVPIGLLLFTYTSDLWIRVAVGAGIGFLFGALVGALLGGGLAMQSPAEPLAAEVGTTVRVTTGSEETEGLMARFGPIRLDRFEEGQRVATPATEGPSGVRETVDELRRNTTDPRRQG